MWQRGLHAVLWSDIGKLMHRLAAEPCSTAGLLFPSRRPSLTILLTPCSMVWDGRVSRAMPMLLYWPKLLYPNYSLLFSLSLLSVYMLFCGAGSFGLIGCISLSLNLALLNFFNNNNNVKTNDNVVYNYCSAAPLLLFLLKLQYYYCLKRWAMQAKESVTDTLQVIPR